MVRSGASNANHYLTGFRNPEVRCIRFCMLFPIDGQFDAEAQQPQPNQASGQNTGVLKP
jgi:hypothetical protein